MADEGSESAQSWARASDSNTDDGSSESLRLWKRLALGALVLVTMLMGVVAVTLPKSIKYPQLMDENLELKQQVKEIEGQLSEVDHILIRMRLYDAQLKAIVEEKNLPKGVGDSTP